MCWHTAVFYRYACGGSEHSTKEHACDIKVKYDIWARGGFVGPAVPACRTLLGQDKVVHEVPMGCMGAQVTCNLNTLQ